MNRKPRLVNPPRQCCQRRRNRKSPGVGEGSARLIPAMNIARSRSSAVTVWRADRSWHPATSCVVTARRTSLLGERLEVDELSGASLRCADGHRVQINLADHVLVICEAKAVEHDPIR